MYKRTIWHRSVDVIIQHEAAWRWRRWSVWQHGRSGWWIGCDDIVVFGDGGERRGQVALVWMQNVTCTTSGTTRIFAIGFRSDDHLPQTSCGAEIHSVS